MGKKQEIVSKKFYKNCSENSRSQIVFRTDIFRKLTLGAPELTPFSLFLVCRCLFGCRVDDIKDDICR